MDHLRKGCRAAALACTVALVLGACSGDADPRPAPRESGTAVPLPSTALRLPPPPPGGFDPAVQVVIDGAPTLTAEVARRPDQRARGLMQRTSLADDAGMVFLFPDRGRGGFYMLGTLIPLSIAYVDGDRVVSTAEMVPCPGQQCPTYPPDAPYTMAVEASKGFFPRYGVKAGTRIRVIGSTAAPE